MEALFIQAEAGGPSWQVWPEQDAIPPGIIQETRSYLFELRDSDNTLDADLLIDDIPAEALRSRQPRVARWRWTPGFHAGTVEAVLRIPAVSSRRFEIITDPDLRKLTRTSFDRMVRELLEDTFALFSLSAFRKSIARQSGSRPPALARLEFLRSRANEITETVAAIDRSPRHFLRAEEVTVPAHKATRATGPEIIKSFRSGHILSETSSPSRLPVALCGRLPAKISLRKRRNSVDIPEHRQIKACLRSWAAWLMNVADILDRTAVADDPENRTTAATWAVRTRHIARKISNASASPFLKDVGEGPATLRMSSLFRRDPAYQRFYRLWQDMNLGLAALFGDFLQMPLARTYELYELWCFLRLVRAAAEEYGPEDIDVSNLFISDDTGSVTIAAGAVMVPVGGGNMLCFQKKYREYWIEPGNLGSFSRTMVPDIVFTRPATDITGARLIVLDAKYRINQGLNDALNSIHTYRDALVQEAESGRTEGIVTAAYLLTPYIPELGADFQSTQLPGRLFHPQYREKFRFGAVTLRPGMSLDDLRVCLKTIVADAVV
ncbi:restriction endonuclease-like protein [Methylomonas sp. SURF-1]|uniref:Restriction endonuclease-like protein n=1 Tax=Methylomonas aurea TaxID=2952224 RepID=A0ABT1UKA1_9GAMM|nr:DUF2357 domain-containing protein [Methylomonas sp. SURF-1]MCQ8182638.1 restriction endonuclease-like protein [Methylomonas sp. SURF-1]